MDPIQRLALAMAVFVTLDIAFLLVSPEKWRNALNTIYTFPWLCAVLSLGLAVYSLRLLLASGMDISQVFAAMLFMSALLVFGACGFAGDLRVFARKVLGEDQARRKVLPMALAWLLLAGWAFVFLAR